MKTKSILLIAETFGIVAFETGLKRVCGLDEHLNELLRDYPNSLHNRKEHLLTIRIMKHWYKGWDKANLFDKSWRAS